MSKLTPREYNSVAVSIADSGIEHGPEGWRAWTMTNILSRHTGESLSQRRYDSPWWPTKAVAEEQLKVMMAHLSEALEETGVEIANVVEEGRHR